jgi:hypothetical protein
VTQTTDPTTAAVPPAGAEGIRESLRGKYVCPFCGSVNDNEQGTCPRCTMENSAATRKATKTRIGPWYVLQTRNPAAPGMTWETLIGFIRKGRVKPRSIVRGPTTHQLWRFAAHVKGLSREFGLCFSCGSAIDPTANICPQCNRLQEPPLNPDALLEHEGEESSRGPIYRELPGPANAGAAAAAAAPEPAPAAPPPPEEVDIVIPALGGFGADDLDPVEPKFSAGPAVTPDVAPRGPQGRPSSPSSSPFSIPSPDVSPASPQQAPRRNAPARPAAAAFGSASPPARRLRALPITICWFGQITSQTLKNMIRAK